MFFSKLLVLAPHTDDAELGCGGAIARFIEEGKEVHVAAFSTATESLPPGSPPDMLKNEFSQAMETMRVPADNVYVYDYPVRRLSYFRQEVLEELIRLRQNVQPTAVFVPSVNDLHQDHQVLHIEGLRAFKEVTVWGYELPWNHVTFTANAFVRIEQRHLDKKWQVLRCYKSQLDLGRPYFSPQFIEGLARIRGCQVKGEFAEAFEVVRVRV